MKINGMPESYAHYLETHKEYEGEYECYVSGCTRPAYFEGGDSRCWCPMCEEHAGMKDRYLSLMRRAEAKVHTRMLWDKTDQTLEPLLNTIRSRIKEVE